jgi:G3E family GTPase
MKNIDCLDIQKDEDQANDQPLNELLLRQIVHADKILVNKIDQLKDDTKDKVLEDIHASIVRVNKHAFVQETTFAKATLEFLLEKTQDTNVQNELRQSVGSNHALSHQIMDQIKSVYVKLDPKLRLNKDKLEQYIGTLIWEGPSTMDIHVMRCKGIF